MSSLLPELHQRTIVEPFYALIQKEDELIVVCQSGINS